MYGVFDRFVKKQAKAKSLIEASFLSEEMQDAYWKIILRAYKALKPE
jgi:hypothetical protein